MMGRLERVRQSLLSLALLAILGLAAGAAWALVQSRQAPVARAQDILRHIRETTLLPVWGRRQSTLWYLVQDSSGRAAGYTVSMRKPTREGYQGVIFRRAGDTQHGESWTLDPSAVEGSYVATIGGRGIADTQITLKAGQVTVTKPWAGGRGKATRSAPANYIPEGLMPLVITEVARTSAEARFYFTYNPESLIRGELHFTAVTMTPQGDGKVRVRSAFLQGEMDETYHLDAKGEIFRIDDNLSHAGTRLIDFRSLAGMFPEIAEIRRSLEEESAGPQEDDTGIEGPDPVPSRQPQEARL